MQGAAGAAAAAGSAPGPNQDAPTLVLQDPLDQARFEADKRAVYKHPLFPLLALLLERCELATAGAEPPAADAFSADLQAFVQHQRRDRLPFLVDDPEIDGLMIKSIQVLRIHLLELEKVQELCRDFCGRYIACLKTKMQSENLLRTDYTSGVIESNNNHTGLDDHSSTSNSPQYQSLPSLPSQMAAYAASAPSVPPAEYPLSAGPPLPPPLPAPFEPPLAPFEPPLPLDYHTGPGSCNSYDSNLVVHGSTPIGQIGVGLAMSDGYTTGGATSASCSPRSGSPPEGADDDLGSGIGNDEDEARKAKRGVLPRQATQAMRAWLFQHLVHPYPTEEEKRTLAAETRLTLLQVNNWFINARRRILQPMLDAGSVDKNSGTGVKRKASGSVGKRFWPENLSQPHFSAGLLSSSDEEGEEEDQSEPEEEAGDTSNDTQPYGLQTQQ